MKNIEVIARVLLIHENKLFLDYNSEKDFYYIPGGHVEFGETFETCLKRELMEENGAEITVGKPIKFFENFFEDSDGPHHEINRLYEGTINTPPEHIKDLEEKIHSRWIPLDELKHIKILPEVMQDFVVGYLKNQH